ncbi:hypothetical protein HY389_01185 [Candidatus Daviesbacteria bacterium]|nr:hypothetical protein [Candidatus Daviesbacteria bacterium]
MVDSEPKYFNEILGSITSREYNFITNFLEHSGIDKIKSGLTTQVKHPLTPEDINALRRQIIQQFGFIEFAFRKEATSLLPEESRLMWKTFQDVVNKTAALEYLEHSGEGQNKIVINRATLSTQLMSLKENPQLLYERHLDSRFTYRDRCYRLPNAVSLNENNGQLKVHQVYNFQPYFPSEYTEYRAEELARLFLDLDVSEITKGILAKATGTEPTDIVLPQTRPTLSLTLLAVSSPPPQGIDSELSKHYDRIISMGITSPKRLSAFLLKIIAGVNPEGVDHF